MSTKNPSWLLEYSGGLDSTYTLYDWLRNPANKQKTILVHHVNLHHPKENRLYAEKAAVKNVLEWFRENGLRNFEYHESSFDYGSLPRISVKDIQIVSMFSGIILRTPKWKTINNLILSWHKGEVNATAINRGYRIRAMFTALDIEREIEFHFPIEFKTRKDMVEDMPEELLGLVHSCRHPVNYISCRRCRTCVEYLEEGLEPL